MARQSFIQSLLCALIFIHGCGTSIGNPPKDKQETQSAPVGFRVTSKDGADFYAKDSKGSNVARIKLDVNRLVLSNVSFYKGTKPAAPTFAGTYLIDLVAGTIEPAADLAQLSANTYTDTSFSLAVAAKGQFPTIKDDDKLIGNSFHIKGSIDWNGTRRDFEYTLPLSQDIALQGVLPPGATNAIVGGKAQTLIIGLSVSQWFTNIKEEDLNNLSQLFTKILTGIQETTSIEAQITP